MPKIDLSPSDWSEVESILKHQVPEFEVWAFGSRVKWTAKQYSDLDLAIITSKPLNIGRISAIKEAFDESVLPIKVDIVDWASTSDSFKEIIKKDRVVVKPVQGCAGLGQWKSTTLGEICKAQGGAIQTGPFGSQLHTSDYKQTGTPVVMPTNIGDGGIVTDGIARIDETDVERLSQHKLQINDIVFSRRGDVTKNALIRERELNWLCGTGCLKVRLGVEAIANAKFISHCLRLPEIKEWLIRHAVGATMPNLNTGILSAVPINLPPLEIQHEIAAMLDALDNRITLLRETNATLEAIAQALFKSWFVDFDPVRDKMEGRVPEGMDTETAALFPDGFEESEFGLVPRGWSRASYTDTVKVIGGGTPKTSEPKYWDGEIPWFSVVDAPATTDVFVIDTAKHITVNGLNNSSTKLLPEGTTIISARGTVGRLALVGREMTMNQSCYGLRGNAGDSYFTYFSTYRLVESLKQRSHGSVFDTITTETMKGVTVVYPDRAAIDAFEATIKPVMNRIRENLIQAHTLAQLRDTLLPRLISGQLRVGGNAVSHKRSNAL